MQLALPHHKDVLQHVKELGKWWRPCVAVDDSKMGGRHSEIQIQCKLFFQLSCNCLKVSEKIFISSRLEIHGLRGYLSIFDQNVHKCSLSDTKEAMH